MLQTLKNYSAQESAAILASVTRQLLPEEFVEIEDPTNPTYGDLRERVLTEVYSKLKLTADKRSEESQAQVVNYLGREMSRAALAGSDLRQLAERVGQQGNLRPDAYKVILTSAHEKDANTYGVTRVSIKDVVNLPDDFQHLLTGVFGPTDNAISLFVKEYDNQPDPFTILVQAKRNGSTLTVQRAFKIYHSDVDLSEATTPLEVLLAFVDTYGVEITVGDETRKFIMYKSIPRGDPPKDVNFFSVPGRFDSGTKLNSGFHFMVTENTIEIAVGYMINETKYLADMKKHK